ncbi:MAG: hypothetical protein A2126_02205 [Candidatus Woykebacteria bacterium GWB1_45_5]|uniref:Uncharacterized protein n=2 Tax=Candidatus Woykeibacteriota TaxID=1817899 RepID=A0A1G1W319_9BACT|nr:MAG: hypothetical protein A2113_02625 [Candidatus Woykebacteria bacterium GWA1_44_8]OGY23943.1 MAG: hypothetical protein A2126_02205 [Candidatus Woykebacteria bacterium GWB1_45_5]
MKSTTVLEKTIATLEKELKTLKELKTATPKEPTQKDTLRGIWKDLDITDEEIEEAKKELNF